MGCYRFGISINAETEEIKIKAEPLTNGLASCGVYARGKFCGNLNFVARLGFCAPPSDRQAAATLGAIRVTMVEENY